VAIAEYIAGSEEAFVARMNERAQELGATHTHFVNPHGLHDPNHYTTARDLATIARAALRQPMVRRFCSLREKQIPWAGHPWPRTLRNLNQLLERYPEADGVKTGSTRQAGPCLVFSATHHDWQLVGVVLKAPHRWEDSEALLQYGFANFERRGVIHRGETLCTVPVAEGVVNRVTAVADRDVTVIVGRGQPNPPLEFILPERLKAPLSPHAPFGQVVVKGYHCSGQALLTTPQEIQQAWWAALRDRARPYSLAGVPAGLLLCLVLYGTLAKGHRLRWRRFATPRRRVRPRRPRLR
jgi:D-alanyl-D-alanine carboxypeptidase (penicillin-binding protein 5/6)